MVLTDPSCPPDRPRERIFRHGGAALADEDLIALILGGGHSLRRADAVMATLGGLEGLRGACPQELLAVPGIGEAGAAALAAAVELGRRTQQLGLPSAVVLRRPQDVERYARARFGDGVQETFAVFGLDARQRVRLERVVAVGSLAQVDVHPREVYRPLVRAGMHSVIAVHNHPSGDPEPSQADIELTQRLHQVGCLLGIPLLDHLVVTRNHWVSLAALGVFPAPGEDLRLSGERV